MKRRRPLAMAVALAAVALGVASRPTVARGDGITSNTTGSASYRLTTAEDIPVPDPNSTGPQVVARVVPPGAVVPPKDNEGKEISPLSILGSSNGFSQEGLIVALKDSISNGGGTPEQLFGLSFFGDGFKKTGQLDFSLSIDKAVTNPPVLESLTPGVSIVALQTTEPPIVPTVTPPTSPVNANVPEPMSLALWSALTGLGFWRARRFRVQVAAARA